MTFFFSVVYETAVYQAKSDDFEVAFHLPIGDVFPKLAFLPLAAGSEVIDERVAEQDAGGFRSLKTLRRIPQGGRQVEPLREFKVVSVSTDGWFRLDLVLNAPKARADGCGQSQVTGKGS